MSELLEAECGLEYSEKLWEPPHMFIGFPSKDPPGSYSEEPGKIPFEPWRVRGRVAIVKHT